MIDVITYPIYKVILTCTDKYAWREVSSVIEVFFLILEEFRYRIYQNK
jgi:hypothetical protein